VYIVTFVAGGLGDINITSRHTGPTSLFSGCELGVVRYSGVLVGNSRQQRGKSTVSTVRLADRPLR